MLTTLITPRLLLRPLGPDDAAAITAMIGDWDVARWLTSVPYPYALADAQEFLSGPMAAEVYGIEVDGAFAGAVGMHAGTDEPDHELGYWLGQPFWGRGYMSEAARAVVGHHFATGGGDLVSGYLVGNARSCAILTRLGFRDTALIDRFARPHGRPMPLQRMALAAIDWSDGNAR